MEILNVLEDWVLHAAEQPWVLGVVYALCTIDGFFPPLPSESVVIALASLSIAGTAVPLWWLVPVAAAGAMTGDLIAFAIGRSIPLRRLRLFRSERGQNLLDWAERHLRRRGGVFIISARYVPVGRVAVNMGAGAMGFPLRRFILFDGVAAVLWAVYSVGIGTVAGAVFADNHLLAIAAGIVGGVVIGFGLDRLLQRAGLGPTELVGDSRPEGEVAGSGADVTTAGRGDSPVAGTHAVEKATPAAVDRARE